MGWRLCRPDELQLHGGGVMNFELRISQREESSLRKLWHMCGLALCLNENLDYVSPTIGTDATGSQHIGIITGRAPHFLRPVTPAPGCVGPRNTHGSLTSRPAGSGNEPQSLGWKSNEWRMRHGRQLTGITLLWLVGPNIGWDCFSHNVL